MDVSSNKFLQAGSARQFGGMQHFMSQQTDGASDTSSQRHTGFMPSHARNPQSRKSVLEDEDAPNTDDLQ